MKPFTLVTTVFNEASRLEQTIADIEAQTLKPTQVIVTDAGSNDGTYERLMKWRQDSTIDVVVLQMPRCNIAEGRNLAIKKSDHELIASTDFGCRYHPNWLESLMTPFFEDEKVVLTGGNFTVREDEITTPAAKAAYLLSNGYQNTMDSSFIPSSRSIAYYRHVWEDIGGYEEWLTLAADDYTFGLLLRKQGYKANLAKEPYVYWGRHNTAKAYEKESFRYGLGDGEAGVNLRNVISMSIEGILRVSFVIGFFVITFLILNEKIDYSWYIVLVPFLFGLRSYSGTFKNWQRLKSDKYNFSVFLQALLATRKNPGFLYERLLERHLS